MYTTVKEVVAVTCLDEKMEIALVNSGNDVGSDAAARDPSRKARLRASLPAHCVPQLIASWLGLLTYANTCLE